MPPPWPRLAAQLRTAPAEVAAGYREVAAAVEASRVPTVPPIVRVDPISRDELAAAPDDALRMLDTWGWLLTMTDDLAGVGRAVTQPPPAEAESGARESGARTGGG